MGGFTSSTRVTREPQHYPDAKGGDEGMLIQCDNIQSSFSANRKHNWCGASAFWQYADYAGFDTKKLTYCGVVDVARIPKFGAYFYQSQTDPALDLSAYGIQSGPMAFIANTWAEDSPNQVRVFSNCDTVKLYLDDTLIASQESDKTMWDPRGKYPDTDGGSYPSQSSGCEVSTEHLDHPPFTFDLSGHTPGQGTLRAEGYINGKKVAEFVRKAPDAANKITLRAENDSPLKLDGSTTKLVWVDVKDANGVNIAKNEITFTTEGPGFVIGEKQVPVRGGQWAVWVRSQRGSSNITLTASAEGLQSAFITIPTETVAGLPEVPQGGDADETLFVPQPEENPNIFLNKPTSASSINNGGNGLEEARFANDGDENTKWCAKVTDTSDSSLGGHWWQADLQKSYNIKDMRIVFDMAGNYKYQIAVSDDPNFMDYKVSEHTTLTAKDKAVEVPVNQTGRYVRIYLNCPSATIWPCLREVYGADVSVMPMVQEVEKKSMQSAKLHWIPRRQFRMRVLHMKL